MIKGINTIDPTADRSAVHAVTSYDRRDVLRILRIPSKQLRGWERAGLIACGAAYSFQDLVQLRKLRDLRATRLSAASIRASVSAMQSVSGMANPLVEASAVAAGSRLAFRHSGGMMDPLSRQFLLDFEPVRQSRIAHVDTLRGAQAAREAELQSMFLQAIGCEEVADLETASSFYKQILEREPAHAPACINLGTIHYNQRHFLLAEKLYRLATLADDGYALAFFDLGNVLDELMRVPESIEAYRTAIRLAPSYADAHYNLALAYERSGERRKALPHWSAYTRLDPVGPWANHARGQIQKILERERMSVIHSPGRRLRAASSDLSPALLYVVKP